MLMVSFKEEKPGSLTALETPFRQSLIIFVRWTYPQGLSGGLKQLGGFTSVVYEASSGIIAKPYFYLREE